MHNYVVLNDPRELIDDGGTALVFSFSPTHCFLFEES